MNRAIWIRFGTLAVLWSLPRSAIAEGSRPFDPGDDIAGAYAASARTMPKGFMAVRDRQIALLEFLYAVHDRIQLSAGMTLPVMQVGFTLDAKVLLVDHSRFRLSGLASFGTLIFYIGPNIYLVGGGPALVADLCLDETCRSSVSIGSQFYPVFVSEKWHDTRDHWTIFLVNSHAAAVVAVSAKVKLLFGFGHAGGKPHSGGRFESALYLDYGVRLHGENFGLDLWLVRPFVAFDGAEPRSVEEVMKYLPIGYPFLSFTYQWR